MLKARNLPAAPNIPDAGRTVARSGNYQTAVAAEMCRNNRITVAEFTD
jgi:hypothetical protein